MLSTLRPPKIWKELFKTPLYFKKTRLPYTKAELLFIAIKPECREKGVAVKLIQIALEELRNRNIAKVKVTVVRHNTVVNNLLRKLGFNLIRSFDFYGKEMNLYNYRL